MPASGEREQLSGAALCWRAGGEGHARRTQTIQEWEDQAKVMLQAAARAEAAAGGAEVAFKRFSSLKAGIKERKRALRGVLSQALTQRSAAAQATVVSPRVCLNCCTCTCSRLCDGLSVCGINDTLVHLLRS